MCGKEFLRDVFEECQNILYKILTVDKSVLRTIKNGFQVYIFPDGTIKYGDEKEILGYKPSKVLLGKVFLNNVYLYLSSDLDYMIREIDIYKDKDIRDYCVGSIETRVDDLPEFFTKDRRFLRDCWKDIGVVENLGVFEGFSENFAGSFISLYEDSGNMYVKDFHGIHKVSKNDIECLCDSLPDISIHKINWINGRLSGKIYTRKSDVPGEKDVLLR